MGQDLEMRGGRVLNSSHARRNLSRRHTLRAGANEQAEDVEAADLEAASTRAESTTAVPQEGNAQRRQQRAHQRHQSTIQALAQLQLRRLERPALSPLDFAQREVEETCGKPLPRKWKVPETTL